MQLKGLVRIFAILLILISLYQLSFTWFVRSHEGKMKERAEKQVKASFPALEAGGDKAVWQSNFNDAVKLRLRSLLDSTSQTKITWWGTTYKVAKQNEFKLGLDLQGGMNVTMEVGMGDLLRSLSGFSKDKAFNDALNQALQQKANSGKDLIDLFVEAYRAKAPGNKLAPLFAAGSSKKINFESSDDQVLAYLRSQSDDAFDKTAKILATRIDRFGVASPTINPDKVKKIITVELAGVTDKEQVRMLLQSSANLQFFELYNIGEVFESLQKAEKTIFALSQGDKKVVDTAKVTGDTTARAETGNKAIDTLNKTAAVDDTSAAAHPIFAMMQPAQPRMDGQKQVFASEIGYVAQKDTARLGDLLRNPAVANQLPNNLRFMYGKLGGEDDQKGIFGVYAIKTVDGHRAKLEGEHVTRARQGNDPVTGNVNITMDMDDIGKGVWGRMTGENVGKGIAIVLDDLVQSAPVVNGPITGGNSQITGSYTEKDAQLLADMLESGKLPAPAKIVQEQVVGATLGDDAVKGGFMSFGISFLVIFALMIIYYSTSGWVANIALILNLLFTIGTLASIGATLTAAGIAGLVLTIGMAVDTNVIIYERIKEELAKGLSYPAAVATGYRRSLAPVLDAHVTTGLTALILLYFGLGPVRGFATTQIIGILLNLFCGILISRLITDSMTSKNKHLQYFTGISKKIFKHTQFQFIKFRKVAYGISVVVALLGVGSIFYGFDYGVEFKGGRSYTVQFDKPVNVEDVRQELEKETYFEVAPIIKTVGNNSTLNITTSYLIDQPGAKVDSAVESRLYAGLSKFLPQGLSYAAFDQNFKKGSQTVLPTISADLKAGAVKATIFSILIIMLYIFIRFRDWRYSLGTIVALLHDVLVTLAVFSFLRKIVPFPLEIDQHFIAAVLTVIGFSMNDTVIVFDRIRENTHLMHGQSNANIINRSINDTLSRTIMTSLTVFLTILILFIFGGEVTRGFAFAMLIGVITGTYSSIFVAAPILVDIAKDKPLGEPALPAATKPKKEIV